MGYANYKSELNPVATALGTDPTTYDTTIQTAPGILNPSLSTNTHYIDRIDLLVNKGKASALAPAAMAGAITAAVGRCRNGFRHPEKRPMAASSPFTPIHCRREVNMTASNKAHLHRRWRGRGHRDWSKRPRCAARGTKRERCWYCGSPLRDPET